MLALFFSVHVYVHVYVRVCAHICACVCTDVDMSTCVCLFLHMFVCVYRSQRSASDTCLPLLIFLYLISFIFVCFMRCLSPCFESTIQTALTSRCTGRIFLNLPPSAGLQASTPMAGFHMGPGNPNFGLCECEAGTLLSAKVQYLHFALCCQTFKFLLLLLKCFL